MLILAFVITYVVGLPLMPVLRPVEAALGPFGEWMYAVAVAPVALTVLCLNRPLFFGPPAFRQGEDWARRH